MSEFLQTILAFPTVVYTVLLGVALCYWLFVIVGAIGIDVLDGSTEGAGKAAGDALAGAAKGAAEAVSGAAKGAAEALAGGAKGAAEAAAGSAKALAGNPGDADLSDQAHSAAGMLAWLGLGKVPVTVSMSAIVFASWFFSALGTTTLAPSVGLTGSLPVKLAVFALSLVAAVLVSSLALRPLHRVFDAPKALERRKALFGRVCLVTSGKVDATFGTATFDDGGAGVLINVSCGKPNGLKKGAQALIIDYDPSRDAYEVEPIDHLLPDEQQAISDPTQASAVAAAARTRTR